MAQHFYNTLHTWSLNSSLKWLLSFLPFCRWGMSVRLKVKPFIQRHQRQRQRLVAGFDLRSLQSKHYDWATQRGKMSEKGFGAGQRLGDLRCGKVRGQSQGEPGKRLLDQGLEIHLGEGVSSGAHPEAPLCSYTFEILFYYDIPQFF